MKPIILFAAASLAALAQYVPAPIFTDPPVNHAHPARMEVLHIPSHGVAINGVMYQAAGSDLHPTLVLCHGLPGNEKNLDLAQAARRAGWNAVTFNYRGSWGSPGEFRFEHNIEDADAVLAYLRDPANASKLNVDTKRIVLLGHSMGGWVTVHVASHDHALLGAILISAADIGLVGSMPMPDLEKFMSENMEALSVTAKVAAEDLKSHSKQFLFANAAPGLAGTPLLIITSDDGLAKHADTLLHAIEARGGHKATTLHIPTDHSYSDHRIALESAVLTWLAGLQ